MNDNIIEFISRDLSNGSCSFPFFGLSPLFKPLVLPWDFLLYNYWILTKPLLQPFRSCRFFSCHLLIRTINQIYFNILLCFQLIFLLILVLMRTIDNILSIFSYLRVIFLLINYYLFGGLRLFSLNYFIIYVLTFYSRGGLLHFLYKFPLFSTFRGRDLIILLIWLFKIIRYVSFLMYCFFRDLNILMRRNRRIISCNFSLLHIISRLLFIIHFFLYIVHFFY